LRRQFPDPDCGTPANTTTAAVTEAATGNYGTIAAERSPPLFTVPANTPCGTPLTIPVNINSSPVPLPEALPFVGQPIIGFTEAFDGGRAGLAHGLTTAH
jgi:hypothetical protein